MSKDNHFDYIIIGNGLAGLQLALGFIKDFHFHTKRVALIDPSEKNTNDKTWSFWEKGKGQWDSIVHKSWKKALFYSNDMELQMPLKEYSYKTIRSIDFYEYAKRKLASHSNIKFITDTIVDIEEVDGLVIIGTTNSYTAEHVFDSRIPKEYSPNDSNFNTIHQHFKGWVIKTDIPSFNPEEFTMMDYRFKYDDSTSFMYVLPFSETEALIEFMFFTPFTVDETVYDTELENYIKQHLQLESYAILETEIGNIPMTDFPFWEFHSAGVTKIGTGGGWVKGSTGYSFKHTEKNVQKILENIKKGNNPNTGIVKKKFKFYDSIFLEVLKNHNGKGIWIFEKFYSKNDIETMLRFLDEETTFSEDLLIMKSLFSMTFINAFFKVIIR